MRRASLVDEISLDPKAGVDTPFYQVALLK